LNIGEWKGKMLQREEGWEFKACPGYSYLKKKERKEGKKGGREGGREVEGRVNN
jgi:hypothetical protein